MRELSPGQELELFLSPMESWNLLNGKEPTRITQGQLLALQKQPQDSLHDHILLSFQSELLLTHPAQAIELLGYFIAWS